MPAKVVLHIGFHKTGTSTVQHLLRTNRTLLRPHVAMRLKPQMTELLHATRGFSTWRDAVSLAKVSRRFDRLLQELPGMPRRTLVISAEELSGHMPGRGDLADYSAAPELARIYVDLVQRHFPDCELALYASTRDPESWLRSAYWEHVKSSSMTLDFTDFVARYGIAGDLDGVVENIAAAVPCRVFRAQLEASRTQRLGPAQPLLELCNVPPETLAQIMPQPVVNASLDPSVLEALLEANRAHTDRGARKAAKQAILAQAQGKDA
ncbi:hypothetical protein [Pseudosulfitobacter sp. DSM 107133]|uniref:hypothetical protein n=1 Tax=Pseudosulfitobacter sp. DSM 107133 TaxID=2883100 RepID=UPI000DF1257A|nr:hypothetical protein [Pseudosulfitobacter sp. DSM 107133]UOA28442.1 hypothetical protein DSM107133_03190 [Pseudosulfitobacter sp. DSM 107133]